MNMLKNTNERNGNLDIISLFTLEFQRWVWYSIQLHLYVNWFDFYSAYP